MTTEKKVRGPYKPRTAPRKVETKPRAAREETVNKLNEFWPQLIRAFNLAKSNNGIIPLKSFYSADFIKKNFGKPSHKLFKEFFIAERVFNHHRADELEQKFREGLITAKWKRVALAYCVEWRWKLRLKKTFESRKLLLEWESRSALKLAEHFASKKR